MRSARDHGRILLRPGEEQSSGHRPVTVPGQPTGEERRRSKQAERARSTQPVEQLQARSSERLANVQLACDCLVLTELPAYSRLLPWHNLMSQITNYHAHPCTDNADHSHGDHNTWVLGETVGLPDPISQPAIAGDHFRRDQRHPVYSHAYSEPDDDRGQCSGNYHISEHLPIMRAKATRSAKMRAVDQADSDNGIEDNWKKRADKANKDDAQLDLREEENAGGYPGNWWYGAQQLQDWKSQIAEPPFPSDQQPEGYADKC